MTGHSENTKRLARNTIYLYLRSFFALVISLYTSRLVLQALGVDDYGIYNAVGGFALMFWLVTGSLTSAVNRFLAYELGEGNQERMKMIFSMSLNIMIGFSLIVLLLAETAGVWYVSSRMTIPEGREAAALYAFQFAAVTVMSGIVVSPFNSSIIAHEKMGVFAAISVAETIIKFIIALFLVYGPVTMDRLILYSGLWMGATLLLQCFTIIYARVSFSECRFRRIFDKELFKELFSYAGWNFMGSFAGTMSEQGITLAMNVVFGPVANAARGVTNTVRNAVSMFVSNFTMALTPQITKAYASSDMEYTKSLAFRGSKFSFYIMFLISLPLILEAEFVLGVWLTEVPEHTVAFIRLAQIISLADLLYLVLTYVQNASGKVRGLQIMLSSITMLNFIVAYAAMKIFKKPELAYVVAILASLLKTVFFIGILKKTIRLTVKELMTGIYFPELAVVLSSSFIPAAICFLMPDGWVRFLVVGSACVICVGLSSLYIGCTRSERAYLFSLVKSSIFKVR